MIWLLILFIAISAFMTRAIMREMKRAVIRQKWRRQIQAVNIKFTLMAEQFQKEMARMGPVMIEMSRNFNKVGTAMREGMKKPDG